MSELAGDWILSSRYRIGSRLGSGATADVFRAHDELLDRDVAVKVFRTPPGDADALSCAARRDAELQSLGRLNHPNLIRLLDGSVCPDEPAYLVLDLVCGPDLATRLHDGPLAEDEVRAIGRQIADALDYAHGMGMVHRDVKPANVLLGDDGPDGSVWARLSDFGTVRMIDGARLTAADLTVGTASYIAPEQARGGDVGPAADVYSLGLLLIEALTGERCFPGTTPEALAGRLARTPDVPGWLAADLAALLTAMTAMEPAHRPSAAAVAECLVAAVPPMVAAAADTEPTAALRSAPPEPAMVAAAEPAPNRTRRRSGVLLALAGLAFVGMLAAAAFALTQGGAPNGGQAPAGPLPSGTGHGTAHRARTSESDVQAVIHTGSNGVRHPRAPLGNAARTATRTTPAAQHPVTSSTALSSPASSSSTPVPSTSTPVPSTSAPTTSAGAGTGAGSAIVTP